MVKIDVELWAYLNQYAPGGQKSFQLEIEREMTIDSLLTNLGIPPDIQKVILVNGHQAKPDTALADGDTVIIFPPTDGG